MCHIKMAAKYRNFLFTLSLLMGSQYQQISPQFLSSSLYMKDWLIDWTLIMFGWLIEFWLRKYKGLGMNACQAACPWNSHKHLNTHISWVGWGGTKDAG